MTYTIVIPSLSENLGKAKRPTPFSKEASWGPLTLHA
jgi:hypothetical protein